MQIKSNLVGVRAGEQKHCRFCNTSEGEMMIHSNKGAEVVYYSCRPCQARNKRLWYNRGDNKLKQQEYNRRYLLRLRNNKSYYG